MCNSGGLTVSEESKRYLLWGIALAPQHMSKAKVDRKGEGKQVFDELAKLNNDFKKTLKNNDEWKKFLRCGPPMKKIGKLSITRYRSLSSYMSFS